MRKNVFNIPVIDFRPFIIGNLCLIITYEDICQNRTKRRIQLDRLVYAWWKCLSHQLFTRLMVCQCRKCEPKHVSRKCSYASVCAVCVVGPKVMSHWPTGWRWLAGTPDQPRKQRCLLSLEMNGNKPMGDMTGNCDQQTSSNSTTKFFLRQSTG